ncbi:DUF6384 family protein [Pseudomonas chlororaphis]|uniref:DUF6384 family protein n=1 Tax=Pseudomonas chlororaphis TaxID=587753 RepID=UPI0015DF727B|nr:DUF6384 family protein [Pseudomonas chlororaphis]QLL14931.1 hypothetical protein H0I86_07555 [Pseudomonas chlororaphis subsp. aurantiaca]
MSQVSLTEQMGAMALIDELRHSQAEVQKHLDLPRHRQLVAERIREFYRSRGIEVEDALVEEGVRSFFATRLTYEAQPMGPWSKCLAQAYITRAQWLMPLAVFSIVSLGAIFMARPVADFFAGVRLQATQTQVDQARAQADARGVQLDRLEKRLSGLESEALANNVPAAVRLLKPVHEALEKVRLAQPVSLPPKVTAQSRAEDAALAVSVTENLKKEAADLQALEPQLNTVAQLLAADTKLKTQVTAGSFAVLGTTYPALAAAATKARSALDQADTQGLPAVQSALGQLDALVTQTSVVSPYLTQLQEARGNLRKMGLSKVDAEQFQPLFAKVDQAVKDMNTAAAEHGLQEIERLRTVAATPLTLEVVSRTGEKSMIERNYDPTGGKTWYLLTEASDASGNVVPVPITSIESGERRYASIFGVRVSQATYQAAKNDKLLDGHVDDRLMGKKAANSLTFTFVKGPVKTKPDYILEW